jgi:hypothetical protein
VTLPRLNLSSRLYHRSLAEFLAEQTVGEGKNLTSNRFYTAPSDQHARIANYYLTYFSQDWQECDAYGLRQLIGHLLDGIKNERRPPLRRQKIRQLLDVVLDSSFRESQLRTLGDPAATLADLRTAIDLALEYDDALGVLACVGAYRSTSRTEHVADGIYRAFDAGDVDTVRASLAAYGQEPEWGKVLHLFLASEAGMRGDVALSKDLVELARDLPVFQAQDVCDALVVRVAVALSQHAHEKLAPIEWLGRLDTEVRAEGLLGAYTTIDDIDDAEAVTVFQQIDNRVRYLMSSDEEAIHRASGVGLYTSAEQTAEFGAELRKLLIRVSHRPEALSRIDAALDFEIVNPYVEYRDILLMPLAVAILHVPDEFWVRHQMILLLDAAFNREGVTFTFDVAALLVAEAKRRGLQLPTLSALEYYGDDARTPEWETSWGTPVRGRAALAAALFRQGDTAEALRTLESAAEAPAGFSGFAVLTLLSLASRCFEMGVPELAHAPMGPYSSGLLAAAASEAQCVSDPRLRQSREQLATRLSELIAMGPPQMQDVPAILSGLNGRAARLAYIDYVSACWSSPTAPNWPGLKSLVPLALTSATTLDSVLARVIGARISQFNDTELKEALVICERDLATGRPWELRSSVFA